MKTLVTGGAGFIGSHVVDQLLAAGHTVAVVDNLSTGKRSQVPEAARFFPADILDTAAFQAILQTERPNAVLHLAAQINVRVSIDDPVRDTRENVLGTVQVLESASRAGVQRFVLASSGGALHSRIPEPPPTEETSPAPSSPYGIAKLCCEYYCRFFSEIRGMTAVALRPANVYGPRQDPHGEAGVVAIFAGKMLRGETPKIFGDGRQTRDYVYVEDIARAFRLALEAPAGTYHVGTGVETDVLTLCRHLRELTGFRGEPVHAPAIPGEIRRSALNASRAARELRWTPQVPLPEGLRRTVEYFRAIPSPA